MQILSQQALETLVRIPLPIVVVGLVLAPVFWLLGWRLHRVLFVGSVTFIAGVYGLVHVPKLLAINKYLAGVLLAVGVGGVAIALMRIGAFVACGLLADSLAVHVAWEYFPGLSGPVRFVAFVAGGMVSVFFYRLVVVLITASVGAVLMVGGVISLTHQTSAYDAIQGMDELQTIAAGALVVLILIGTGAQYLLAYRSPQAVEPGKEGEQTPPDPATED